MLLQWAGKKYGNLLFTSSTVVYGDGSNTVNEGFRLDTRSARATKMISAEEDMIKREGSVIRLAGLYTVDRGPHTFWIKNGEVDSNADGMVNLLHYEDAADVCVEALVSGKPGMIYLASDDEPVTRENLCKAAVASGSIQNAEMPTFASQTGAPGKIIDSSLTKEKLKWSPKYPSFQEYMYRLGGIEYKMGKTMKEKAETLWLGGDDDDIFGGL